MEVEAASPHEVEEVALPLEDGADSLHEEEEVTAVGAEVDFLREAEVVVVIVVDGADLLHEEEEALLREVVVLIKLRFVRLEANGVWEWPHGRDMRILIPSKDWFI